MSDSTDLTLLLEMGFSKEKAERALAESGNTGIESAMEWLMSHEDEPANADAGSSSNGTTTTTTPPEAKSLKCNECNKLFKTTEEVEFHAVKSGHSDFSESTEEKKPLTEEEKKKQLQLLEEKMKQKRAEREGREKADELEREKRRIQDGKQLAAMREKAKDDEARKLVEERKREKAEEAAARARVKAQIEADKAARRAKASGDTAKTSPKSPLTTPVQAKSYGESRLQIRLPNGSALTQTFGSKEPLSAVRLFIEMNRTDGLSGSFGLMTNFPKKNFQDDDYNTPLEALGLVPSAVLIVTRV